MLGWNRVKRFIGISPPHRWYNLFFCFPVLSLLSGLELAGVKKTVCGVGASHPPSFVFLHPLIVSVHPASPLMVTGGVVF